MYIASYIGPIQTMECQTKEWEELYEKRVSPRAPNPKHYYTAIHNDTPSDGEIRAAVKKSSNGRAAGASNMLAEHLKAWLTAMQREEEVLRNGHLIYIGPTCETGVNNLCNAWAQCPADCIPLVIEDLNIRNQDPRDESEEEIADLLDEINIVDTTRKFIQWQSKQHHATQWNRWTWRTNRRTEGYGRKKWIYSHPDYIMARETDMKHIRNARIRTLRYHISDHRAVVLYLKAGNKGRLKTYCKHQQCFPLQLISGPQDKLTEEFEKLKKLCDKPDPKKRPQNSWILDDTWKVVCTMTML